MKVKRKTDRDSGSDFVDVFRGIIVSCILTGLLCALVGTLVLKEMLPEQGGRFGALIIGIISAAGGCLLMVGRSREKRLLWNMCVGAGYLVLLLSMNALFFSGSYQRVGEMALSVLGTCVLFGILGKRRKATVRRRRK